MGNLCQACDRVSLLEPERPKHNPYNYGVILPKENISEFKKEIETEEKEEKEDKEEKENKEEKEEKYELKFEESDVEKTKEKDSEKKTVNINVIKTNDKNDKPRKRISIIKNKSKSSKSLFIDRVGRFDRREIRSQSLTKINQPSKIQDIFYEKIYAKDNESHSQNTKRVFKRKKKKSTTLMENTKVMQQLFNVEMSIPISPTLLIMDQKGNPSENYICGEKVGDGSFGTVYKAKNILFNNTMAMKVINKNDNMDDKIIKNKIDILKKLSHPNIAKIYDFYLSDNCYHIINEFFSEGNIYDYINKGNLNEQQLSIIFYQVLSGLIYLHENDIFHRDIKPENILISKKEKDLLTDEEYFWIQIIDYDCAKIFEENKEENSSSGNIYYFAPEVLNNEYDEKSDSWSVGVILYMFLVGKAPFDGLNNEEIMNSIKTREYDADNEKLNQFSEEVRDLLKGLLNKNTEERLSVKRALNHQWFKKFNGRKLFGNFKGKQIEPFIDNLFNYTFNSKIQQLVMAFLVHNLPTIDSSITILKLYRYFNMAGDCKLTKNELITGLSKYRDEDEVTKKVVNLFLLLDGDNNGFIEFEEFLRACIDKKEILTDDYLKYAFKFLDKEDREIISVQQILSVLSIGDNNLLEIALSKDINDVDEDGDGNINFQEFKKMLRNIKN